MSYAHGMNLKRNGSRESSTRDSDPEYLKRRWEIRRSLASSSGFMNSIKFYLNFIEFPLVLPSPLNGVQWMQSKHLTSRLYDFIYFLFDFLWNITWHPGYIFKVFKLFQSRAFSGGILWKLTRRYPNHPLCRTVDHRHLLVCIEISLKEFLSKKCP